MKTLNNHPQWHKEPLRLTKKEKRNPHIVLEDFFDCFHLQDVREILWRWLVAVISSPQSISFEPLERSNHIYFYEKVEGIIEAAYVMKRKTRRHQRRREKRKFRIDDQPKAQSIKTERPFGSIIPVAGIDTVENEDLPNKAKQLIEYAGENPLHVLKEVFKPDKLVFIIDEIKDWLHIALSADCTSYEEAEQRSNLIIFHDHLLLLIEALFIINLKYTDDADLKGKLFSAYKPCLLNTTQIANPEQVIATFFNKFPTVYINRELDSWYEASISYSGDWRDNVICLQQVWDIYRNVLCLLKSATQILQTCK
ncbi:hypothetical protein A4H97_33705 [Niastella yeongjuensis]|uniref:Uncharacterized protein n=1 Tax=Niastella yeongjuensis TaxID=354355 RepID=A0A1V9EDD5_9BACT|nr:hypothetical protein [Niastella yeongjuensis]OQP44129.1 hypothetical protein A4H97_33705 [Niastella yeongjuensis]SEP49231.1 hypothetical protein SAMN05660816_06921 [Niastella yeongjuensis]